MKTVTRLILSLIAVSIIASAAFLITKEGVQPGRPQGAVPVDVANVTYQDFADIIEAVGTARADESIVITAPVSETIDEIAFTEGEYVEKGAILVRFTADEEQAEVMEWQANLKNARSQYDRTADLVERGNASRQTLDEQFRQVQEARSRIAAAQARLTDRVIRAPFSGVLGLREVSAGTLVSPGTEITTLDDIDPIKLDFAIPEAFIPSVSEGQTIKARSVAFADRAFDGTVALVSTRVDQVTRTGTVRALIPNPEGRLRPGMLMRVELVSNERQQLAVPESAIVPFGANSYVFVIQSGADGTKTAERVRIDIGARRPGLVEVLDGLDQGAMVVTRGAIRLRPGLAVEINEQTGSGAGSTATGAKVGVTAGISE